MTEYTNGILLVEQVPDGVVLVAEAALYHDPPTLVPPELHVRAVATHKVTCLELRGDTYGHTGIKHR